MRRGWLALLVNLSVITFACDGALSLVESAFRGSNASPWLIGPRGVANSLVWTLLLASSLGIYLTPRIPVRVVLPLVLTALWIGLGAIPLPLLFEGTAARDACAAAIQLGVALFSFGCIRGLTRGRSWLLFAGGTGGPAFSLRHSLAAVALTLFLLVPAGVVYLLASAAVWIQIATHGFVRFDFEGVTLDDRLYARDGQEIRLVGMMHIGEEASYRAIAESFATESTIVLAEGVTDEQSLLTVPLSYGGAAGALGLSPQDDLRAYLGETANGAMPAWPVVRHADVDLSTFAPETLELLEWGGRVWSTPSPAAALLEILAREDIDAATLATIERDVIESRNTHLILELRAALEEFDRVVVPWGALHLPWIEERVLEDGFELVERGRHPLIFWRTISRALWVEGPNATEPGAAGLGRSGPVRPGSPARRATAD